MIYRCVKVPHIPPFYFFHVFAPRRALAGRKAWDVAGFVAVRPIVQERLVALMCVDMIYTCIHTHKAGYRSICVYMQYISIHI